MINFRKGHEPNNSKNDLAKKLQKILEVKDDYDLILVQSWSGARLAYLANLNYIIYFS